MREFLTGFEVKQVQMPLAPENTKRAGETKGACVRAWVRGWVILGGYGLRYCLGSWGCKGGAFCGATLFLG